MVVYKINQYEIHNKGSALKKALLRCSRWIVLTALFLSACNLPAPAITPTGTLFPTRTLPATWSVSPTLTDTPLSPTITPTSTPEAKRVVILSLDGLRADAVEQAPMKTLQELMQTGAYTLKAQTIQPTATLPAHASMLTGMCPSKTGVDWNDYLPDRGYAHGPSLFDLAHAAGLETYMVVGKQKLVQVTDPASLTGFRYINDRDVAIMRRVLDDFPRNFGVLFIHFPTPDAMGSTYGWPSWQYYDVLRQADGALASLLQDLDQLGLRSQTLVIVTADHGGNGTGHYDSNDPLDLTIPWVASGPGVIPGELNVPVSTTDTAATAAWALGLARPAEWDGIPVYEAFGLTSPARPDPRCG